MKITKSTSNMLILASFTLLFASCNNEISEVTPIENKDFSVINGVTIKTEIFSELQQIKSQDPVTKNYAFVGDTVIIYKNPSINTVSGVVPDLKSLKSVNDNKPLRMIAIGGSLTAGVRDGGYFNEGILTSYPNLVARQMQIEFKQPYFDDASFNGFGRKVPTTNNPTGGPVQKFNVVKNNLGVESATVGNIVFKKYKGTSLDNYAVPYLDRQVMGGLAVDDYLYRGGNKGIDIPLRREALYRFMDEKGSYTQKVLEAKSDLMLIEFRQTEVLNNLLGGNSNIGLFVKESKVFEEKPYDKTKFGFDLDLTGELDFLRKLEDNNIKNVILLNAPNFLAFPYFNSITDDMIKKANLGNKLIMYDGKKLLPSPRIDSLLSPKIENTLKVLDSNHPLTRLDAILVGNNCVCDNYNNEINLFSKRFGFPIVDIKTLYDKVINNTYTSDDGLKVTSKEFFSTDGIYPSALGQACIANETIKVINNTYKTSIPLIKIREFLSK
jgi:hypothetical protein